MSQIVLLGALAIGAGCSSEDSAAPSDLQARAAMTLLGRQYSDYLAQHGAPPRDKAAMRQFLQAKLPELTAYNVKSVDDLMGAGRDGRPVKIVCGAKVSLPDQSPYAWAAYEQVGVDGKRLVVNTRGGVFELAADEFERQVPID